MDTGALYAPCRRAALSVSTLECMHFVMVRTRLHIFWLAGVLGGVVFAGCSDGCQTSSGPDASRSQAPESWPESVPYARRLPARAEAILFARSATSVADSIGFVATRTPPKWLESLPVELADPSVEALERAGLDADRPVVGFRLDGCWGAVAALEHPDRLESSLRARAEAEGVELADTSRGWQLVHEGGATREDGVVHVWTRESAVAAVRCASDANAKEPETRADGSTPPLDWFVGDAPREASWRADPRRRRLVVTSAKREGDVAGYLEAGSWLARLETEGRARRLLERFARQLGPVGVRLHRKTSDRTFELGLYTPGSPGMPKVVSRLGRPEGTLPSVGGLVEPGVLGVVRLSVDATALYRLVRSTLPAERRRQIETFWRKSSRELDIEGPARLASHFSGHVVVVIYGFDGERLEMDEPGIGRRILELEATREAILLPIRSRPPIERTLDALTQLSRGKLSRQNAEHTVHYAWLDEGLLKWAFVLSDEHLLYVDSATAFDQAMIYERRGGSLGRDMGSLERLFEGPDRSGIYLDTATLADLLDESGAEAAAKWLTPFQSLLLIGDADERPHSMQIELTLGDE